MEKLQKFTLEDFYWTLMLFGTAIGAGVLFLPVQACMTGFLVFIVTLILSLPANYLSHIIVMRLLDSTNEPENYIQVIAQYLGRTVSAFFGFFYFLMLYITLVAYSIALNSNVGTYLYNIGLTVSDLSVNPFFAVIIIGILIFIIASSEKIIVRISGFICIALMITLIIVSIFMIHLWDFNNASLVIFPIKKTVNDFLRTFPILLLSIVFFPAVSYDGSL